MLRAIGMLTALVFVIVGSSSAQAQQTKQQKKKCSYEKCYSNCMARGGAGGAGGFSPARTCGYLCNQRGCT